MAKVIFTCFVLVIVATLASCTAARPFPTVSSSIRDQLDAARVKVGAGKRYFFSTGPVRTSSTQTEEGVTTFEPEEVVEDMMLGPCREDFDESSIDLERACHRVLIPDYGTPGAGKDDKYP
jgi:hypothetical protein